MQKITDAYKLWLNILPHFPKLIRYSLGEKINLLFVELMELVLMAGFTAKELKLPIIQKACSMLDILKFFMRIAWELKAIDNKKFIPISASLVETGKMLGGWQKQLKKTPPVRGGE